MKQPPLDFSLKLQRAFPGSSVYLKWEDYSPEPTHVWPVTGRLFERSVDTAGNTWYSWLKTAEHPAERASPLPNCRPAGRWCVYQIPKKGGVPSHVMDVVNEDGSLHPLDDNLLAALKRRELPAHRITRDHPICDKAFNFRDKVTARQTKEHMDRAHEPFKDIFDRMYGIAHIPVCDTLKARGNFDSYTVVDKRRFKPEVISGGNESRNLEQASGEAPRANG